MATKEKPNWQDYQPKEEEVTEAQRLIDEGYKQISAHYRMLCRIPKGMTAFEALKARSPTAAQNLLERFEMWAEAEYMRIHSQPEDRVEVSVGVYKAFKRLGGPVAH